MAFNLVYLSQQDPQWKNDILGFASDPKDTIGFVGCALTSVSMLLSGYGFLGNSPIPKPKTKSETGLCRLGHPLGRGQPGPSGSKAAVQCPLRDERCAAWPDRRSLECRSACVVRVDASPNPGCSGTMCWSMPARVTIT